MHEEVVMEKKVEVAPSLPLYKCHKLVHAAKITEIYNRGTTDELIFGELECEVRFMPREWIERHKPIVGGYFVEYADGYKSFSPAEAFEGGYSRV